MLVVCGGRASPHVCSNDVIPCCACPRSQIVREVQLLSMCCEQGGVTATLEGEGPGRHDVRDDAKLAHGLPQDDAQQQPLEKTGEGEGEVARKAFCPELLAKLNDGERGWLRSARLLTHAVDGRALPPGWCCEVNLSAPSDSVYRLRDYCFEIGIPPHYPRESPVVRARGVTLTTCMLAGCAALYMHAPGLRTCLWTTAKPWMSYKRLAQAQPPRGS